MSKVLVIAPHPDDETLGCGGTLLKHSAQGDEVFWLIMTEMLASEGYAAERIGKRREEISLVSAGYGFKGVHSLGLPTTRLDTIPRAEVVSRLCGVFDAVMPETIYMPNGSDVHSDHKVTFEATYSAIKTFRRPYVKRALIYETISETEFAPPFSGCAFTPNSFSDISAFMDEKIALMLRYEGETGEHPFPRSVENIRALATVRGAASGARCAEAFMLLKEIW